MPRLQPKTFATPDEIRDFSEGQAEVVRLDEVTVGRSQWAHTPASRKTPTGSPTSS